MMNDASPHSTIAPHEMTDEGKRGSQRKSRPTIGLLIRKVSDEFSAPLWNGATDVAREQDVNLIGFVGGLLHSPQGFEAQGNVLYDLADVESLDGLVVWTGMLGHYVGPQAMKEFCGNYRPLPMTSLEQALEGIPSVVLDFRQGMRDVIAHLIEVHGYRRIAFIRGPEDSVTAKERYRAYADTLAEFDIPLDPDLVAPGTFFSPSGVAAMRLLLDERRVDFEAVVAANDTMALNALRALQARGIRVPDEVAVVGFDDVEEARSVTPPLTTVRVPFYEWGRRGVEMLLAQLRGEEVPELEQLPLDLVVRQSCGCMAPAVLGAAVEPVMAIPASSSWEDTSASMSETLEVAFLTRRDEILSELAQRVGPPFDGIVSEWGEQLLDALVAEVGGDLPGSFLSTLDRALSEVVTAGGDITAWQGVLSTLRRHALPYLADNEARSRAENLWEQSRVMVGEVAQRVEAYRRFQMEQRAEGLREIGQALATTSDIAALKDVLVQELPRVGIRRCYLSLYEDADSPAEWSKLILAYDEEGSGELEADGQRFPSRQLAPTGLLPDDRRYGLVVEPLYFREDQLGFAVFEASLREEAVCDTLRGQISSALKGAMLVQQAESRALQLQTAAVVSRAASGILDPDELVQQVVDLVCQRFNLYYAGLFLVDRSGEWTDEPGKWAVLRAGSGDAGRHMLEAGHKLEVGSESMIGWCVANAQARIALDVGEEAVRFDNPWLPDTRSEMALPLISRGQVIGAMTIQSTEGAAFSDEDIAVLQTMADQLAAAIENAWLYGQSQQELAERKRAEEAIARERDLLRSLMDNAPDMIFFKDAESRIIRSNRAHAQLLGLADPEEAVGKTDFDLFSPEDAPGFYEEEQEIIRSGKPIIDRVGQTPDLQTGELRWLSETKVPLKSETGQAIGLLGIARDITARRQAEIELERRNAQLQTTAEVSRVATSLLDPEELMQKVVNLVRERFRLYYAGLFLVDRTGEWTGEPGRWAALRAGSGEAGRHMLEAGHKLEVGGESMIGWCVANAQARIALDVGEEAVRFDNPWLPDTRSEMALPLISRGQVIGAMTIQSTEGVAFSDEDIAVLQSMADQLAAAIENARLFEEQSGRAHELATLNQIAVTVNRSQSLHELLEAVLETVMTAQGYDAGLISLRDEATGNLVLASHQGLPEPMVRVLEQQGLAGTLCDLVFQTGETRCISDVRRDAPVDVSGLIQHGLYSYIGIPLMYQDELLGTVCLFSRSVRDSSAEKLSLLESIGHQIGVGIENVRLLDETQQALQEARAAHQQYLRREWHSFLTSRQNQEGLGYVLTQDGLKPTPQVWPPEIQLAMQSQRPVIVTDAEELPSPGQDGGDDENVPERVVEARSALATPITLRGQVIGALDLFEPDQPRQWTDDDLTLVDAVTSQVALAVENARLFEQAQVALAETEALYRASHRITASNDLPELYQTLVNEMAVRLGAHQCQLTIFDQEKGYGEIVAEHRLTPNVDKTPVPMVSNPAYVMLRDTQKVLAVEDVSADPAFAHLPDVPGRGDVKSMLLVPIEVRGDLIGSLEIDYVGQQRTFSEDELDFCQTLARQAAITIDNMRAFEEQKETAERLREMDKLKTQFLANMSHELRTPLNSIIGFSRVILKGIDGPLTEMQETDLTAIYSSGQHLLGLINDILDLSKIEAGKMELNFDETDLKLIIKGVMSSAVGLCKDKDVELEHGVPDDLPNVWADATRIRQVLLNLVSNATKFTEEGKISVTADHDDEWVTVSVADTGEGIPEDNLDSIFEEFTQVDGSTTRSAGGTGLGLPISRYFVEMHGGKITVESELGVGSIFTLVLPIYAQGQPEMRLIEDRSEGRGEAEERQTVLTVDDDPGVISLYRRYLESEGYQVVGITNSEEVLDKASQIQPFAITLDVLMPTKDGWQVLRELKACPQTQHIPIIVCSIVSNEGLGFSLGAADYLVKPIMEEELLAALNRVNRKEEGEVEVLVIDDQADDILLIRRMLEAQHRYRVTEADGGQAGIDLVHERKPDIVILDLMMPEVDGFAVLEDLKRESDTRDIPVVVITAKELTEEEQQRLNGQVEVLLRKGLFTEQELLEDLGKALISIESGQPET